ncbi:MAG: hypothetical protein LIO87_11240 [Eubacterium sp.]|nr:hypothetical protein [Eubacterium sp.]
MNRLLPVVLTALCLLCGCGGDDGVINIAFEAGETCPEEIKTVISDYYKGKDIVFSEAERKDLSVNNYDVVVKYINMTTNTGYGVWKSKAIGYENVCAAGYDDYRISSDFSGKKAAVYGDFNLSDYTAVVDDCEYTEYADMDIMISDIKEGAVDVVLCLTDAAETLKAAEPQLRINDILDSDIYEYVVISEDSGLIAEADKVIGD